MSEDLALPSLPQWPGTEPASPSRPKKRVRLSSPIFSSDPVFFSSDDDPSLDNYTRSREKKRFRGPYFVPHPEDSASQGFQYENHGSARKGKRIFERQYDSGVFLGSDGTEMDETIDGMGNVLLAGRLPVRQPRANQTSIKKEPTPEELASKKIALCIENGTESIDLSGQNLTTLSNDTIRPLSALTRVPPVVKGVFDRIEPRLQIFLGSNDLTSLPEELFNLNNLTVLSLRNNKLHELPPAIGRLNSLVELNVSLNGLQYLPFEILDLFSDTSRLESFQIHPNLFHEPHFPPDEQTGEDIEEELRYKIGLGRQPRPRQGVICSSTDYRSRRSWHPQWKIFYKVRTEIRYLDNDGSLCKGPTLSNYTLFGPRKFPDGIPVADEDDIPTPPSPRGSIISRAPSLLEVALTACSKTPELPYLASMLPDNHPNTFPSLLASAAIKKESGGSKCTVCSRNFIVPRTEWIEWWEIAKVVENTTMASAASPLRQMENERDIIERMIPLIRRGCSWLCVPEKMAMEEDDIMAVDE